MRARSTIVAAALLGVVSALTPAGGAVAGSGFSISVPDPTVKLKETFTVEGTNACPDSPYVVRFSYTNHDGGVSTLQADGTTDAEGQFTQPITVPEAATPEQPAEVDATTECVEPEPTPTSSGFVAHRAGTGTTSNTVAIQIEVATGVLSTDRTQGRAGTVVNVSGTNCLGDDVVAVFGNDSGADRVEVTLRPDDTFSGAYTIPNVPPGQYFFAASCPGTDYEDRAFTVLPTPGATPTPLPTTTPVRRPVSYTG